MYSFSDAVGTTFGASDRHMFRTRRSRSARSVVVDVPPRSKPSTTVFFFFFDAKGVGKVISVSQSHPPPQKSFFLSNTQFETMTRPPLSFSFFETTIQKSSSRKSLVLFFFFFFFFFRRPSLSLSLSSRIKVSLANKQSTTTHGEFFFFFFFFFFFCENG